MFKRNTEGKTGPKSIISTIVILAVVGIVFFTGGVKVGTSDTDISISSSLSKATISYGDITGLELRTQLEKGSRTFGVGTAGISSGSFKNTEFGPYKLYIYNAVSAFVVIHCSDEVTVFNMETIEHTQAMYSSLKAKTGL